MRGSDRPWAFVDESYDYVKDGSRERLYVLGAVLVDGGELQRTRWRARAVIHPLTDFHTNELSAVGRRDLVHAMLRYVHDEVGWSVVTVQMPFSGSERRAREACLGVLLPDLSSRQVLRVVADSRPQPRAADRLFLDKQDQRVVRALRSKGEVNRHLTLAHRKPAHENLLWLADAVAWAARRDLAVHDPEHFAIVRDITTVLVVDDQGRRVG